MKTETDMAQKKTGGSTSVSVKRTTEESEVIAKVSIPTERGAVKKGIRSPLQFFNHMIETIAWRACLGIELEVRLSDFKLTHVICEDSGLVLGEAVKGLLAKRMKDGVNGAGAACSCIDEALARCVLSFEDRPQIHISENLLGGAALVEDMQSADLAAFLEGFCQGAGATIHLDLLRGVNPHHVWESAFRALGEALRATFAPCPFRKGTTPGVKGLVRLETD